MSSVSTLKKENIRTYAPVISKNGDKISKIEPKTRKKLNILDKIDKKLLFPIANFKKLWYND